MSENLAESEATSAAGPVVEIQLVGMQLEDAVYRRLGDVPTDGETSAKIQLALAAEWLGADTIAVTFAIRVDSAAALASITYRIALRIVEDLPESACRHAIARIAPVIAYPYARETFTTLAQRAQQTQLVLPILNVGTAFDPEEIDFPARPEPSRD